MGITEDVKRERSEEEDDASETSGQPAPGGAGDERRAASLEATGAPAEHAEEAPDGGVSGALEENKAPEHTPAPGEVASPTQLGTKRFVYAAYFAGAITIAFLMSKVIDFAWFKLQNYKPAIGEARDEVVMPLSALIGALAAVYYWYRTRARQLAEEVAAEMAKVTWPTRTEVTNGTFVVIVTTIVSTVFFALMDKFWGFLTNLVYGGS
jgi:preprotein translocase subunit SecE